jgi:tripartite-type tricarboxylate transporter receptor subunit TctC
MLAAVVSSAASAQVAPPTVSRQPLRIILPVNAGSGMDVAARTIREALSRALGDQPVIVDNRPGAAGVVATRSLIMALPDGATIGLLSNSYVLNRIGPRSTPYDQANDEITPISIIASSPLVFVVNPSTLPARNARELEGTLKATPDRYTYGSTGVGSTTHFAAELYLGGAAVKARNIPYSGTAAMLNDLLAGRIDMGVFAVSLVRQHIEGGALRAIGVMTRSRIPMLADAPTFAEQGYADVELAGWIVAAGPPQLAKQHVSRIYDAFVEALKDRTVAASMAQLGVDIVLMPPEETARFLQAERDRYAKLARKLGLPPQ